MSQKDQKPDHDDDWKQLISDNEYLDFIAKNTAQTARHTRYIFFLLLIVAGLVFEHLHPNWWHTPWWP